MSRVIVTTSDLRWRVSLRRAKTWCEPTVECQGASGSHGPAPLMAVAARRAAFHQYFDSHRVINAGEDST